LTIVRKYGFLLVIAPAVVLYGLFLVLPLLSLLITSVFPSGSFSVKEYAKIFNTPAYVQIVLRTLLIGISSTLLALFMGYPVAYSIARSGSAIVRKIGLIAVTISFFTFTITRVYAWLVIETRSGVLNFILTTLGLPPIVFLGTVPGIVLGTAHYLVPLVALALVNSIQRIDNNLLESALSLGANRVETFLKITLPLSLGGILAASGLSLAMGLTMFITPDILGKGFLPMLSNIIYDRFTISYDATAGAAMSITLLAISLVSVLLISRVLMSRVRVD
jgi:putative spermidine/putrescine transport system permease protein